MSETLGAAVLELRTDNKAYKKGFKRALSDAKRFVKRAAKIAKTIAKFTVIPAAAVAGISIKMAADMEKGIREIGTLMGGLTDNEMRAMGQELEVIASKTGQAMEMLTTARYDIVSAGFASAADSAELLRVSADLATAGVTDIVKAGDLLTTTMNAYGFAAEDAVRISDKLFTTVRLGKTTIEGMAGSLGRVLGVAGTLGIDLDELLAAFATLTTTMGSSERAVTAVSGAINSLLTPTADLDRIIQALGHDTALAMIEELGFADSIQAVVDKAEDMGIAVTDAISGMEGLQGILPLTGTAAETFAENIEGVRDSLGATTDAAAQMQLDFTLQMNRLKQNVANIMRALGRSLIEVIQPRIEEANTIMQRLGDIGWDVVASTVIDNWRLVLDAAVEITKIMAPEIGRVLKIGIKEGIVGVIDIIRDLTTRPLAKLLFGWAMDIEEGVGQSFESLGVNISEIITNLITEIERLAAEAKPPLNDLGETAKNLRTVFEITRQEWELLVQSMIDGNRAITTSTGEMAIDAGQLLSLFASSLGTAFGETTTAGDAFKEFIIGIINLMEGVIIASIATNKALRAMWKGKKGIVIAIAALIVLEAAKAKVRNVKFAHGGIINAPTLFPVGNAVAEVAEAGRPEGILPLERMAGGDLGVQAAGMTGDITLSVTIQRSVIANRQTVRDLLLPPLEDFAQKLQSKLVRRA